MQIHQYMYMRLIAGSSCTDILETSQEPLNLCAQEHADHDHNVTLDASPQDLNLEPDAGVAGMVGFLLIMHLELTHSALTRLYLSWEGNPLIVYDFGCMYR